MVLALKLDYTTCFRYIFLLSKILLCANGAK